MKGNKMIYVIYILIVIIIISIVFLTKNVLKSVPKKNTYDTSGVEPLEINPYPEVDEKCVFDVSYVEFGMLTKAGCSSGYTKYNINDIVLDGNQLSLSVIFSDSKNSNDGVFVNDNRIITGIKNVSDIKFGIFGGLLFVFDKGSSNVFSVNSKGDIIYNLSNYLKKNKVKDLSTGDVNIKLKYLDSDSFVFSDGFFEFNAITGKCQNGDSSKGSHYKVKYNGEKFDKPEFESLINC